MSDQASPGLAPPQTFVDPSRARGRSGTEAAIRVALVCGIAFQVLQRFVHKGYDLSSFERSQWYVTYEFGFVRRGLAGEVVRRLIGRTPTVAEVAALQTVITAFTIACAVWLVVLLCRQRTRIGYATAALFVIAPFGFDLVGGSRRPDLLVFALLVAVGGAAAARRRDPVLVGIVAGALLALSALVSEAAALIAGPWLVLLVAALARARGRAPWVAGVAMVAAAAPAAVALAVVAATGRAGPFEVVGLEWAAPAGVGGRGTVFPYLSDTLGDSVGHVLERRPLFSLVVGAVLAGAFLAVAKPLLRHAAVTWRWVLPSRRLRLVWSSGLAGCTTLLFALGFDWMRWITFVGFAALLAAAGIVLLVGDVCPPGSRPRGSEAWYRPLPTGSPVSLRVVTVVAATYLLAFPPLPVSVHDLDQTIRMLVFVNAPG